MIFEYNKDLLCVDTAEGIQYNLQLRPRITVVRGDSGTGKTFLVDTLRNMKKISKELDLHDADNIVIFDGELPLDSERLVIIDRGDLVIDEELTNQILVTKYLHFLIFARKPLALNLTPNYYGEFVRTDNLVTIKYRFNERLWFM